MKRTLLTQIWTVAAIAMLTLPAVSQIVYTPVYVSIPVGGYYNLDLNQDGVTDFIIRSGLLQDYCQFGDGYVWSLAITPATGNSIVTATGHAGPTYASALNYGVRIDSSQGFDAQPNLMAGISWGSCGIGSLGEWLNLPNRYLGLQFRGPDNQLHYAWAKASTVAYVDQAGRLHASTTLSGAAYQTVPNRRILAGQMVEIP